MTVFANSTLGVPRGWDTAIGTSLIICMTTSLVVNPMVIFYHSRKRASEAKLLFILLGVFDFTTLFLTPIVNVWSFLMGTPDVISESGASWYKQIATWNSEISVQYSAFITSVLSLTRCISIAHPFYQINITLLLICLVIWFVYLLGFRLVIKYFESSHYGCDFVWDPFAQLTVPHVNCPWLATSSYKMIYVVNATILQRGVWIVISLFSLIFTLSKLHRRPSRTARKSEVTVIILTSAYLLAFIPMIVENVLWLCNSYMLADNSYYLYYIMVSYPGQILSAVNPLIIIARSRELQRFLVQCIRYPFSRAKGPYLNTVSKPSGEQQKRYSGEMVKSNPKTKFRLRIPRKLPERREDILVRLPSDPANQLSMVVSSVRLDGFSSGGVSPPSNSSLLGNVRTLSPVSNSSLFGNVRTLSPGKMRRACSADVEGGGRPSEPGTVAFRERPASASQL